MGDQFSLLTVWQSLQKNAAHAIVRNLTIAHFDNFLDEEGEK